MVILKSKNDAYIAAPSWVAVLFLKMEFSIVKLPQDWTTAPPKLACELRNFEFLMYVPSVEFVFSSISTAPPFLSADVFVNVQLFISPYFNSLRPIAPAVSSACKFSNEESLTVIFP